ncbi:hypothetical protein F511_40380 [Dorcoceras hygrometricum]|uniref:Protein N-lysine methyltransferase METTL21A n=1 Tax=Dorcoceras hygrometricum TaxID=472368 RepID=A0A2Z7C183_9LAMI|nr:hypothetical protein F511_40380 [Dorcoceras hygrometricum]
MEEDDVVCLDASFFVNDNYQLTKFSFGSQVLELYCLQSASICMAADYDLTGQLVWPGAVLLNNFLSENEELLRGCSVIELGSGVGITGMLCHRFCREVVLTDHNDEILEKNIELHESSQESQAGLKSEKLEWGNSEQLEKILQDHPEGFDLILGADIYILIIVISCIIFQQCSIPSLFDTVEKILRVRQQGNCKFILAYVSRAKVMDALVISEAIRHGLLVSEVTGTRTIVKNLEGVIFEITCGRTQATGNSDS